MTHGRATNTQNLYGDVPNFADPGRKILTRLNAGRAQLRSRGSTPGEARRARAYCQVPTGSASFFLQLMWGGSG